MTLAGSGALNHNHFPGVNFTGCYLLFCLNSHSSHALWRLSCASDDPSLRPLRYSSLLPFLGSQVHPQYPSAHPIYGFQMCTLIKYIRCLLYYNWTIHTGNLPSYWLLFAKVFIDSSTSSFRLFNKVLQILGPLSSYFSQLKFVNSFSWILLRVFSSLSLILSPTISMGTKFWRGFARISLSYKMNGDEILKGFCKDKFILRFQWGRNFEGVLQG